LGAVLFQGRPTLQKAPKLMDTTLLEMSTSISYSKTLDPRGALIMPSIRAIRRNPGEMRRTPF
ncbi:hypothetical protein BGZ79_006574, partial [Entomortierella chlamydospora]